MAALSQFISRLGEKGLPFFKLLVAKEKFKWLEEADKEGETLLLYIAAINRVVSTAIIVEREEVGHVYKVQRPVYFISEVLNQSKTHYP
jgi:hypothetical protein